MPIGQLLKVSIRSLRVNKVRSFLTMLGVIIGVASVILLMALGEGIQRYIKDQLEGVGSNLVMVMPGNMDLENMGQGGGGGTNFMNSKLTAEDAKKIEAGSTSVKMAIPMILSQSSVKYNDEKMFIEVQGNVANFTSVINSPLALGDYFSESDDRGGRKVAIIGSKVAEELFGNENPINEKISLGDNRFEVVGVLKARGVGGSSMEDHVVIPYTTASRIFNQDKATAIYAQATDAETVDLAIEEVKYILSDRLKEDEFTVLTQKDLLGAVSSILGTLTAALAGIAAISLLVGGIGIMNIMLVSVTERTREIGLRKSLGATPNIILLQFLMEAVILSVGGGLLGILIGELGSLALSSFISAKVTWTSILLAFGVSVTVGVIFGVMPARRASRLNPIEALRYE